MNFMTEESAWNPSPLESNGETRINFISAGILPLDSAWSEINVVRDGGMFDNRDASYVLSVAGMPKCELFSLLRFHAAISVAIGASWAWPQLPVSYGEKFWHGTWHEFSFHKQSPGEFPSLPRGSSILYAADHWNMVHFHPAADTVPIIHTQLEESIKQELK